MHNLIYLLYNINYKTDDVSSANSTVTVVASDPDLRDVGHGCKRSQELHFV